MPVPSAHPDAVKLDEAFAAAMEAPAKPREPGPPPEVDNEAPFGRDEAGKPNAPHGYKKDGTVRRTGGGRRPKEEQARVGAAGPAKDGAKTGKSKPAEPVQYAPAIADTLEVGWLGLSALGKIGPTLPFVGRFLPEHKLNAQAALILASKMQLAGALDLCAQHNASARKLAEKFAAGQVNWAFTATFMVLPFVNTSVRVWQDNEFAAQLAEQNHAAFDQYFAAMHAKMAGTESPDTEAQGIDEDADIHEAA